MKGKAVTIVLACTANAVMSLAPSSPKDEKNTPHWGPRSVVAEYLIGVSENGREIALSGNLIQLAADRAGRFVIIDPRANTVWHFERDGRLITSFRLPEIDYKQGRYFAARPPELNADGTLLLYWLQRRPCMARLADRQIHCSNYFEGKTDGYFIEAVMKNGVAVAMERIDSNPDPANGYLPNRKRVRDWLWLELKSMSEKPLDQPPPGLYLWEGVDDDAHIERNGQRIEVTGAIAHGILTTILGAKFLVTELESDFDGDEEETPHHLSLNELGGRQIADRQVPGSFAWTLGASGDILYLKKFKNRSFVMMRIALEPGNGRPAALPSRPLYYDRDLKYADLFGRPLHELDLMRNWIYARVGNPFRKKWLHGFFAAQPWYHPLEKMDESKLTDLDRRNARYIADYVVDLDHRELRRQAEALHEKAEAGTLTDDEKLEVRVLSVRLGKWYGSEKEQGDYKPNPLENRDELDRQLTIDDLADLSPRDLRLLRNTIYARRGKPFHGASLAQYFESTPWYKPDPEFTEARLTPLDHRNAQIILSVEKTLGGPQSEKEAAANLFALEGA